MYVIVSLYVYFMTIQLEMDIIDEKNHRESLCHLTVIVIPPNQAEEGWSLINTYFRHVPGESQISVNMSALQ